MGGAPHTMQSKAGEISKAEPCVFRRLVDDGVALMVGVHLDDTIVSGKKYACNKSL